MQSLPGQGLKHSIPDFVLQGLMSQHWPGIQDAVEGRQVGFKEQGCILPMQTVTTLFALLQELVLLLQICRCKVRDSSSRSRSWDILRRCASRLMKGHWHHQSLSVRVQRCLSLTFNIALENIQSVLCLSEIPTVQLECIIEVMKRVFEQNWAKVSHWTAEQRWSEALQFALTLVIHEKVFMGIFKFLCL